MSPRALLPLLTVLGTTAAAAVLAQKYIPQYMANKHNPEAQTKKKQSAETMKPTTTIATPTKPQPQPQPSDTKEPHARSSLLVALLLQDSYLLISAFGVCVMVVAVLVSLALVSLREDVSSLNDLQMFPPLMLTAMGMICVGMVASMVSGQPPVAAHEELATSEEPSKEEEPPVMMPMDGKDPKQEGFLYAYYRNKYGQQGQEEDEEDEDGQPKKRVSKCPFGFT